LRNLEPGERVGYGGTWTTPRRSRIATIPVGYADGLSRQLSSRGQVIVRGSYAPMVGRISMDLTSIDVTDIEGVMIGDEVVIIGSQGNLRIGADTMAAIAGTVPYEVLCNIGKRVPRKYYE
jgi:alanine racemase